MTEQDQLDDERTRDMRRMLSQPGGDEAVRQRYGDAALGSDEYRRAQAQLRSTRERQSRAREQAADAAEQRTREARDRQREQAERESQARHQRQAEAGQVHGRDNASQPRTAADVRAERLAATQERINEANKVAAQRKAQAQSAGQAM